MPKGSPNRQTVASTKWHKKVGYKTKAFNLRGDVADRFAEACDKAGVSQASKIAELMERFIKEMDGEQE